MSVNISVANKKETSTICSQLKSQAVGMRVEGHLMLELSYWPQGQRAAS